MRGVISAAMPGFYWVEAELSEVREGYGGHCYMELIEKEPQSNTPVAKAHASCWRNRWMYIKPRFERITGQALHSGMKVLLKVRAQFHENYGFSWIVDDIDPNYTMGDMMRKRMEIVRALKEQGVFDLRERARAPDVLPAHSCGVKRIGGRLWRLLQPACRQFQRTGVPYRSVSCHDAG